MQYCVTCGEAVIGMTWKVAIDMKSTAYGLEWVNHALAFCPSKDCPRYGLITGMVETLLEDAKAIRKKFAESLPNPLPLPPNSSSPPSEGGSLPVAEQFS